MLAMRPVAWGAQPWIKPKLDRRQRIAYLAARLRLLNCFQWSAPGDVDYRDRQLARPGRDLAESQMLERLINPYREKPPEVINPYVELRAMDIQAAELPALEPFLADDNYMPIYGYWRMWHPQRTLYQVHEIVSELVADARRSRKEWLLESLSSAGLERAFSGAGCGKAAGRGIAHLPAAFPRLSARPRGRCSVLLLAGLGRRGAGGPPVAFVRARGGAVLGRPRSPAARRPRRREGWAALEPLVAKEIHPWEVARPLRVEAVRALLDLGDPKAMAWAWTIFMKVHRSDPFGSIYQRFFLAGIRDCLHQLLAKIDSEEPEARFFFFRDGRRVDRPLVEGDLFAVMISAWRSDGIEFDYFAPDNDRRASRKRIKEWLKAQFALVQEGKRPSLRILAEDVGMRLATAHDSRSWAIWVQRQAVSGPTERALSVNHGCVKIDGKGDFACRAGRPADRTEAQGALDSARLIQRFVKERLS